MLTSMTSRPVIDSIAVDNAVAHRIGDLVDRRGIVHLHGEIDRGLAGADLHAHPGRLVLLPADAPDDVAQRPDRVPPRSATLSTSRAAIPAILATTDSSMEVVPAIALSSDTISPRAGAAGVAGVLRDGRGSLCWSCSAKPTTVPNCVAGIAFLHPRQGTLTPG